MTLIVEDGTGLSTAESYASVAEADLWHSNYGNTAWAALTTLNKEIALRKATDYMVAVFRGSWQGWRYVRTQALDWPRAYVYRDAYDYVSNTVVPPEVKAACIELALISTTTSLLPTSMVRGKKRVKVGPLEVEYDGDGETVAGFVNAVRRLAPLLGDGNNSFTSRLVRS